MLGLAIGIAVQTCRFGTFEQRLNFIRTNIKSYGHPSVWRREELEQYSARGLFSARYFKALDACPLRMRK